MRQIVVTGGPCTGKSTLLDELMFSPNGPYGFLGEIARPLIAEQEALKTDCLPWKNNIKFQNEVLRRQLALEETADPAMRYVFQDRGIVDCLAYFWVKDDEPPQSVLDAMAAHRYDRVFILDRLWFYMQDAQRKEDPEFALRIHDLICEAYSDVGYDAIYVPPMNPTERAAFVESML